MLSNSIFANTSRMKEEKMKQEKKINTFFWRKNSSRVSFFESENERISDKIKTNSVDEFVPKHATHIEEEDKIKKENFTDEALKLSLISFFLKKNQQYNSLICLMILLRKNL